ncbi:hypothetical protein KIH41_11260 [Litoribacter ruber]|uniref:hypothetical protein n=1 Tax=Litoribacter ruber TaxID=702568 RepID=UPI001BD96B83|nr:hypothetical protein [Litoribacter ruber]MBT0811855.1 hypothetical protein [Litoribacter ruber]
MKNSKSFSIKVIFFALLLTGMACTDLLAQKGNNQLAIGAELGPVLTGRYHGYQFQLGLPIKAYYGVGNHGQLMFRTGLHHLWVPPAELFEPTRSVYAYLVPLGLGYRRNFNNWYFEGSAGAAWEKSFTNTGNPFVGTVSFDHFHLNYGVEFGKQLRNFDVGLSIQNNTINGQPGLIHTGMVGFKVMYKIGG